MEFGKRFLGYLFDSGQREIDINMWLEKFRNVLKDVSQNLEYNEENKHFFIESVRTTLYNDDIQVYTPEGKAMLLPKKSTALDFAFAVSNDVGMHAKYAKINGHLASVKTILKRGDSVEIGVDENIMPQEDWRTSAKTYEALRSINIYLDHLPKPKYCRCNSCHPIPGEEVIGFKENDGTITVHRRDCTLAISLVSQFGDNIVAADDFKENSETLYPASLTLKAVDRKHLLSDIIETISNQLHLSILSLNTNTVDEIVTTTINFTIHSYQELRTIVQNIQNIPDVDEVIYNNK